MGFRFFPDGDTPELYAPAAKPLLREPECGRACRGEGGCATLVPETDRAPHRAEKEAVMSAASEKSELWTLAPIAHIHTDFTEKFGIPRQSGLVAALNAFIVFTPEYRDPAALRGIEGYDYLWLLWRFSANPEQKSFSPTVRPPRLGGNKRMGVFATRSPIRPNPVGLSSVRLLGVEDGGTNGAVLRVAGADLIDGTPIYDIKPYLPGADSHPGARDGFVGENTWQPLAVECPPVLLARLPEEKREAALGVLAQDPRPAYQDDAARVYGMAFGGYDIRFTVAGAVLTVTDIAPAERKPL